MDKKEKSVEGEMAIRDDRSDVKQTTTGLRIC
jgi:hypothetical protein